MSDRYLTFTDLPDDMPTVRERPGYGFTPQPYYIKAGDVVSGDKIQWHDTFRADDGSSISTNYVMRVKRVRTLYEGMVVLTTCLEGNNFMCVKFHQDYPVSLVCTPDRGKDVRDAKSDPLVKNSVREVEESATIERNAHHLDFGEFGKIKATTSIFTSPKVEDDGFITINLTINKEFADA